MNVNITTVTRDIKNILKDGIEVSKGTVAKDEFGNLQIVYSNKTATYYYTITSDKCYLGRTGIGDVIVFSKGDIDYVSDPNTTQGSLEYESFRKLYQLLKV